MRVGLNCLGFGPRARGGLDVYTRELIQALQTFDSSPNEYVLILEPGTEPPPIEDPKRFVVARVKRRERRPPLSQLDKAWRYANAILPAVPPPFDVLSRQLDAMRVDVFHYPGTLIPELRLKTRTVLTFFDMQHEFFPEFYSRRERLGRTALYRPSVKKAGIILVPSRFTAMTLESRFRVPASKMRAVPLGVSGKFSPVAPPGERQRLTAKYRLPVGDFVLFPANPWPHKNHRRLFSALKIVEQQVSIRMPLVCTGRLLTEVRSVQALANEEGMAPDQVYDLGFVDDVDMPGIYRSAKLLVFPSLFEGFGLPVLEAMASGCPVVCSNTSALPEIGADAVRTFNPFDPSSIADAIEEVWTRAEVKADLVVRGLRRARLFSWKDTVERTTQAYAAGATLV